MSIRRRNREYRMIAAPSDPQHTLLPARALAIAEGWAMVRRPNCAPFIVSEEDWNAAPIRGS